MYEAFSREVKIEHNLAKFSEETHLPSLYREERHLVEFEKYRCGDGHGSIEKGERQIAQAMQYQASVVSASSGQLCVGGIDEV
jgi:hypothetical protein